MKNLLLISFLAVSISSFSQFSRSFLHSWSNNKPFSSFTFIDDQENIELISARYLDTNSIQILTQEINDEGIVTDFAVNNYNLSIPNMSIFSVFIESTIEIGNERYYSLKLGTPSSSILVWLKVNKSTLDFIDEISNTNLFKSNTIKAVKNNDELVSYHLKTSTSSGLFRIGLNLNSFTFTEELVDINFNSNVSYANTISGNRAGAIHVIGGLEYAVMSSSSGTALIYKRTSSNNYQTITSALSNNASLNSFQTNSNSISLTNGTSILVYDINSNSFTSGTFDLTPPSNRNYVAYSDGKYYLFYKNTPSNTIKYYLADSNYNLTDSITTNFNLFYDLSKTTHGLVLSGNQLKKGLDADLEGNQMDGRPETIELFSEKPSFKTKEYSQNFDVENLSISSGLGTKVFLNYDGTASLRYDNKSSVFNLSEHMIAFLNNGDTLSNVYSTFIEQYDEIPGPFTNESAYTIEQESKYNRAYHVSIEMIENHLDSVQSGSTTYKIPFDIKYWPAHGDITKGQAEHLVPFVDVNSNNIYEPALGDYPSIYGNDCYLSITHLRPNGNDNNAIELHSYVYTLQCDTSDVFNNVVLRKLNIYSRGSSVDSIFFGARMDGDLGNYNDDYAGTNVDLGLIYEFNGDLNDEQNGIYPSFNDTLAAQGIIILKGFKQENDGTDNNISEVPNGYGFSDGINDNEYFGLTSSIVISGNSGALGMSDPNNLDQWKNTFKGYWQLGDTIIYGGDGFPTTNVSDLFVTKYMFPSNDDSTFYATNGIDPGFSWSEIEPNGTGSPMNNTGDRRNIFSLGQTSIANSDFIEIDYAYLIARDTEASDTIWSSVDKLFAKASSVRNSFLANEGPCNIQFDPIDTDLTIEENNENSQNVIVYPNPTNGHLTVSGMENTSIIRIFDVTGKEIDKFQTSQTSSTIDLNGYIGNVFLLQIQSNTYSIQKRVLKL